MAFQNIGNQVDGASSVQFPPANNKAVCRFQNNTGYPITVTKFVGKWISGNPTDKVKAIIYSDNAGSPDSLLASSDEKVGITTGYNTITFSTPYVIGIGEFVWIGVISDTMRLASCISTGSIKYNSDTYSDGPSATFGAPSTANFTYPMWVEGDDGTARLGRASVDTVPGNYQSDREHGEPFILGGSQAASISSISTYVNTASATVKMKAAIFNDNAGLPSTKVAQTNEVTGTLANSWVVLNFPTAQEISPGTYWLCFISSENLVTPTIPGGGLLRAEGTDLESNAFSSPSTLSQSIIPSGIDIYASYTLIEGGAPLWDSSLVKMSINDDAYEFFGSYGWEGSLNSREVQRLESLGFDDWYSYLRSLGYTGNVSDMKLAWLRANGFTDSLNDALFQYYNS